MELRLTIISAGGVEQSLEVTAEQAALIKAYPQTGCKVVDKTLSKTNSLTFR